MRVQDRNDFVEVEVEERATSVWDAGDTRFAVRVRVSSLFSVFTGESLCWVDLPSLDTFARQLRVLEELRQGSAVLESMSPGELRLEILATDRAGHMAAVGQIGWWLGIGSGEPYWSAVAFRVPFCPTQLPALVREFSALAVAPQPES